jgi:tripartite-type tricarboxylate transporter receptor subunit TctC
MTTSSIRLSRLAVLCCALASLPAFPQGFPTKPIKVVVPFPPGGVDVTVRAMQKIMSDELGQPIVIENRPGANGFIGSEYVARSAPDGYTILATSSSTLVAGPLVAANVPFDPIRDFTPITMIFKTVSVLITKPTLPVNSIQELIALARRDPGRLSYASTGIGSAQHLDAETFKLKAGVDLNHIPYKGFGPVVQAMLAQEIDVAYVTVSTIAPLLNQGKFRILAYYNGERPSNIPAVPDLAQAVPGFHAAPGFIGLLGPAGLPKPVLSRLHSAAVKSLNAPEVRRRIEVGGTILVGNTPEQFAAELKSGLETTGAIVKALRATGVKFE